MMSNIKSRGSEARFEVDKNFVWSWVGLTVRGSKIPSFDGHHMWTTPKSFWWKIFQHWNINKQKQRNIFALISRNFFAPSTAISHVSKYSDKLQVLKNILFIFEIFMNFAYKVKKFWEILDWEICFSKRKHLLSFSHLTSILRNTNTFWLFTLSKRQQSAEWISIKLNLKHISHLYADNVE